MWGLRVHDSHDLDATAVLTGGQQVVGVLVVSGDVDGLVGPLGPQVAAAAEQARDEGDRVLFAVKGDASALGLEVVAGAQVHRAAADHFHLALGQDLDVVTTVEVVVGVAVLGQAAGEHADAQFLDVRVEDPGCGHVEFAGLERAGVDTTDAAYIETALDTYGERLDEMERLVEND